MDTPSTVLIVEDESAIRRFVAGALQAEGLRVVEADCLRRGLADAAARRPDVVILDLGLPDGDGIDLIRAIRVWSEVPVIVLSARVEEDDKVDALDAGADDYLTKPFGVPELLARVRVALRRQQRAGGEQGTELAFGEVTVDLVRRRVTRGGVEVHLTQIEYRLLLELLRYPGKVLTHRHLLREVWGPAHVDQTHYLRIYMGHLRQKLEREPARPRHLLTETGVGYRFVPD